VGPANVGQLRSPPSQLRAVITLKGTDEVIDTMSGPKFEGVAAAKTIEGQGFNSGVSKTDKAFYQTPRFNVVSACLTMHGQRTSCMYAIGWLSCFV
jgi:hypothetical protein